MIAVALGAQWSASAPIFAILALGGAFRAMAQLSFWIFLSSGRTRTQMQFNLAAYPVLVVLMIAGLPYQGVGRGARPHGRVRPLLAGVAVGRRRAGGLAFRPLALTALRVLVVVGGGVLVASYAITLIGLPDLVTVVLGVLAAAIWCAAVMAVIPAHRRDLRVLVEFARGVKR